ncbi:MAG: DUF368 domain-containing protein, partial [Micrococcales bacterium]
PGVSGGTVALVTGIYPRLLASGDGIVEAGKGLLVGPDRFARAKAALRTVDWSLLAPLGAGMVLIVVSLAGVMHGFVEGSPQVARALFAGMVAASLVVPLRMARAYRPGPAAVGAGLVGIAAAVAFVLSGMPGGGNVENPSAPVIFVAASVAVCALALPGVSGSYLLLVMGLYAPTLAAVDNRDLGYVIVFGLGAVTGISVFVRLLNKLLSEHGWATLLVMSGLMLGSLRALWPWQHEDRSALAPQDNWPLVLLMFAVGATIVAGTVAAERALATSNEPAGIRR